MTPEPADRERQASTDSPRGGIGRIPWHPAVFAAVIVLTLWIDAAISPYAVIRSLLVAVLLAVGLTVVAGLALRSRDLGGVAASIVIGLLWSKLFGEVGALVLSRMGAVLAGVWLLLIAAVAFVLFRLARKTVRRWTAAGATRVLNQAAVLLLAGTVALGILNGRLLGAVADLQQGADLGAWPSATGSAEAAGPDIYAILLDGYPRADVLEFAFGIDNQGFVNGLEDRGFEVASAGHSDYLWTHVSVPSALNLEYVEEIPKMVDIIADRLPRQPTIRRLMGDSRAFQVAGEQGYTTVGIGSGFEEVAARQADVWVDGGQLNEFEIILLSSTFAGDIVNVMAPEFAASQQGERIRHNLDVLPRIAAIRDRGPAFVFSHVPAPHQPVVFDADGEAVPVPLNLAFFGDSPMERDQSHAEFVERYRDQLPYLNDRILAAIDGIIANAEEPPIILLFADHGSASQVDWITAQPTTVDPALLLERTGILFAAVTPEREGVFPADISPVDMFRLLFDAYFGTDYGRATPPPGGGHIPPVDASVLDDGS